MLIYSGKLTCDSASNEMIIVVFPKGFELNDPVSAFWQSSNDPKLDNKKASVANSGFISTVMKPSDGSSTLIHFSFDFYSFDGTITPNFNTLSLTMFDVMGSYRPFDLTATHINVMNISSVAVYMGTLQWPPYSKEEMVTIVVPYGVTKGTIFGLYYQWTRNPLNGNALKENVAVDGRFQDVEVDPSNGCITATYQEAGFKYEFKFNSDKEGSFVLSHKQLPGESADNRFVVVYKL